MATTAPKVKVSATSLLDSNAVRNVSTWILLHDGKMAGKILWTVNSGGTWKCCIACWNEELFGLAKRETNDWHLTGKVIGSAGGGGYDKRSASFADCLTRNGIQTNIALSGRGSGAVQDYLTALGFTHFGVL